MRNFPGGGASESAATSSPPSSMAWYEQETPKTKRVKGYLGDLASFGRESQGIIYGPE